MFLDHTVKDAAGSRQIVSMQKGATLYLALMQARSQSLDVDLERHDVFLNGKQVPRGLDADQVILNSASLIELREPSTIIEID